MSTQYSTESSDLSYRQRAAETRTRRTTAAVVGAAERALLKWLATHPAEPLSRIKMTEICELGTINKTTLFRRFKTVEAVSAAVAEKMRLEGREVPAQIDELAKRHLRDESWKDDSAPAPRLIARTDAVAAVADLRRGYDEAVSRGDRTEVIYWCTELTEQYFADCARQDLRKAEKALDYANQGLGLVDPSDDTHCRLGFRLTQTAARAELLLSTRRLHYETTGLSRIRSLKEKEIEFATALGWELKAELARFHRDRSAGLCDDRVETEISSIKAIITTLKELSKPAAARARSLQDALPADELSGVISRLCGIEMAYADHPDYAQTFWAAFPNGAARAKADLLSLFTNASGEDARDECRDAAALVRLQNLDVELREARRRGTSLNDAIKEYEQAPVDLLRSARFGIIRHVLVARYLTAKAESQMPESDGSSIRASSLDLIELAIYFYAHAEAVTRRRGAGGMLRHHARKGREALKSRYHDDVRDTYAETAPVPAAEFKEFQQTVNDLVLKAFTYRARMNSDQIEALRDLVKPIGRYLDRGQI